MKRRFLPVIIATFWFLSGPAVSAGELTLFWGGAAMFDTPTLLGAGAGAGYRGDAGSSGFFETDLILHWMTGSVEENDSTTRVTFKSVELDVYYLLGKPTGFYFGPGLGYGIAEVDEKLGSRSRSAGNDTTNYFTGKDIHYGAYMLKFGSDWGEGQALELRLSSYGGLIGSTLFIKYMF